MSMYVYWFLLALILAGLEMATGTFYLLIVAIAMAIGGGVAFLGFAFTVQLALAAFAGIAGISLLRRWKGTQVSGTTSHSLDIGQPVKVLIWRDDTTARVFYRGAEWNAKLEHKNVEHEGVFYIKDIQGSILVLTNRKAV